LAEDFIFIPLTVNIEDQNINQFFAKLYPNPVSDMFYLELPGKIIYQYQNLQLEMYNTKGQTMLTHPLNKTQTSINVSAINNGIYYYKLFSDDIVVANGKLLIK